MNTHQKGFSAVEAVIILVVVTLVILGGWLVWSKNKGDEQPNASTSQEANEESTEEKQQAEAEEEVSEKYKQYSNEELGVSFEYPASWSKPKEEKQDGISYIRLYSPDYKIDDDSDFLDVTSGGSLNIMVNAAFGSGDFMLNEYEDIIEYHNLEGGIYGVGALGDDNTSTTTFNGVYAINGKKCGHPRANAECLVFIKNKRYYDIYYQHEVTETANNAKYRSVYQHLLDTFKIE